MTQGIAAEEKTFKKGEVIYRQGDYVAAIYDVLRGQVALYVDYHQPTQRLLTEVEDDGFFGVVGFLESVPRMPLPWRWRKRCAASSPTRISATTFRSGPPRS